MKLNTYLRYGIVTGIFLIPFIAFIVLTNMFFPFITGKNFLFRILVEVLLGLYLVLAVRNPEYRPKFSWLLSAFFGFLVVIGIADLFGENPFKSFWSNFERMEGYITFIHLFAYFIVVGAIINTEKLWEKLLQTSLGASILLSFYALLQVAGKLQIHQGETRVDASLGNSTYLAIYIVFHIFIALFLYFRHRPNLFTRFFYGTVILFQLFVLYQTETRGAILGLIGGLFLTTLIIALFEKENRGIRKGAIFGLVGIVLLVGLFMAVRNTSFIQSSPTLARLSTISISDAKSNPRIPIWNLAIEGFKEKPILGWGQENFNYVFNKYYDPILYPQEQWFDRTHNVIFDWLIAGGLLGLLGYLSLYFLALFYVWKKGEFSFKEKAVFTGMLAAYFFHNLFVFDNLISLIIFVTFLSYLHSHAVRRKIVISSNKSAAWLNISVMPIAVFITVGFLYFFNWGPILANSNLLKAISNSQDVEKSLGFFKKSLAYDSFGNQEALEQLMQYAINLRNAQGVPDATKIKVFEFTESEMAKMLAQAPNDTRHHLFFGSVLDTYGKSELAEGHLLKALELSPKKQSILFQLGTHYLNVGNTQKALETFKIAHDLEPSYREARLIYAMGAIYAKNLVLSEQILKDEIVIDDRLIQAYITSGFYEKAITIGKEKIKQNPQDPNVRLSLAGIYYRAGQKGNAVAIIRELMLGNPDFKAQGEALIKQIEEGSL